MRQSFLDHQEPPAGYIQDVGWLEKDEEGNLMPGNIEGGIYWAINNTLPLVRLHYIKQLGLLSFSSEEEKNLYPLANEFTQTRLNHTYLTARVLEFILRKNGFSQEEVNLGIIAGLVHDLGTPALGDATKEIDPEALSEERALARILDKYDISTLEVLGFNKEKVLAAVAGEGTLGQLLDIADKITYTADDLYFCIGNIDSLEPAITQIAKIIKEDSHWADIYQEVAITKNEQPYFKDPERLGHFLELRALMHQAFYLNPHCRGREMMYRMLMQPLYSREPNPDFLFNQENLSLFTDWEVGRILNNHWEIMPRGTPLDFALGVLPDYVIVETPKQIPTAVKDLESQGRLPIAAETIREFNPGVDFLTFDPSDRRIKPYHLVRPEHAQALARIVDECCRTVVYYWPEDKFIEEIWGKTLRTVITRLVAGQIPYYRLY